MENGLHEPISYIFLGVNIVRKLINFIQAELEKEDHLFLILGFLAFFPWIFFLNQKYFF